MFDQDSYPIRANLTDQKVGTVSADDRGSLTTEVRAEFTIEIDDSGGGDPLKELRDDLENLIDEHTE